MRGGIIRMLNKLKKNTVQDTLCIPLWGRMLAAEKYPELCPDHDAKRIIREIGCDLSHNSLYKFEYTYLIYMVRQYDLAWEINNYLKSHPKAAVVELGAGLSTLRSQMKNNTNPWYNLDMEEVIVLRKQHIPNGENEKNVICNLNDFSWFDSIDYKNEDGIVFVAGGLFYYFEKRKAKELFAAMDKHFPGGMIAFDATNSIGLKGVNKEVKMAGNDTKSYFSLKNCKKELEGWSPDIINVSEKDYMRGYIEEDFRPGLVSRIVFKVMKKCHLSFIVHAEFAK